MTIIHSDKYLIYEIIQGLWISIKCWKFEKEESTWESLFLGIMHFH